MKNFQFSAGQTLIEVIAALGIAALVIISMLQLSITSLSNVSSSRLQSEANRYARETMEWLRGERDKDEQTFVERTGWGTATFCLDQLELGWDNSGDCLPTEKIPTETPFRREVTLQAPSLLMGNPVVRATVEVQWTDNKGEHKTRLISDFSLEKYKP